MSPAGRPAVVRGIVEVPSPRLGFIVRTLADARIDAGSHRPVSTKVQHVEVSEYFEYHVMPFADVEEQVVADLDDAAFKGRRGVQNATIRDTRAVVIETRIWSVEAVSCRGRTEFGRVVDSVYAFTNSNQPVNGADWSARRWNGKEFR